MKIYFDDYVENDDFDDFDAADEDTVTAADWDRGYNARVYSELSERERWDVDNPLYEYDQARRYEDLYDIKILEPWRRYSEAKCDAEDDEDFPCQEEWEELQKQEGEI